MTYLKGIQDMSEQERVPHTSTLFHLEGTQRAKLQKPCRQCSLARGDTNLIAVPNLIFHDFKFSAMNFVAF